MDDKDKKLIALLSENSRSSTTTLARTLGVSRSTIQDRIKRLEKSGIIAGYTVRFGNDFRQRQISAQVMMSYHPKFASSIFISLKKMPNVIAVYAVSGIYDMITTVRAETTEELDKTLDEIGELQGMEKTTTSIILSKKYEI